MASEDTSNADSTDYNGGPLVATAIAFLVLTWLSVVLRTYVRVILLKSYRADDWFMLVAQVSRHISS
jgi:hypothetical protein